MELKKVSSAGDPELVMRNRKIINPLWPSIFAVFMQLLATIYLYSVNVPKRAVIASAILTFVYCVVTYLLNKKPKVRKTNIKF